jgi:predicted phage terminase large subunit-like protein
MLPNGFITQSWDTAIKAGPEHDASACATFEFTDGLHRLVDMAVLRLEYPLLKRKVVELAARFGPQAVLIEDKASGQSLLQDLRREVMLPLIGIMPKGDKLTRVAHASGMIEGHQVALPKAAHWLAAFEAEVMAFPTGAHDDQVDAMAQYLNWVRFKGENLINVRFL